jgi:hypothetical protein
MTLTLGHGRIITCLDCCLGGWLSRCMVLGWMVISLDGYLFGLLTCWMVPSWIYYLVGH